MTAHPNEIRYLGDVQRLKFGPDDVLVLTCAEREISTEMAEMLKVHIQRVLGDEHRVLVLTRGMKIGVLTPDEA